MLRVLALSALLFAAGCTMKRTGAASSDTVSTEAKDTSSVQQGVGSSDTPTNPPTDSGKPKPKADDVSNPKTP